MLCLFSISLLIMPPGQLGQYIGINDMNSFLSKYAPVVIASMLSLSCPARFTSLGPVLSAYAHIMGRGNGSNHCVKRYVSKNLRIKIHLN